jgi:hypothetical protein
VYSSHGMYPLGIMTALIYPNERPDSTIGLDQRRCPTWGGRAATGLCDADLGVARQTARHWPDAGAVSHPEVMMRSS